jgi:hypothetical protein
MDQTVTEFWLVNQNKCANFDWLIKTVIELNFDW